MANVRYRGVFFGREQIGKLVTVTDIRTGAPATLTADRNGNQPLANPVTVTGPEGVVEFHAPEGRYRLTADGGYSTDITLQGDGTDTPDPTPPTPPTPVTGSRGAAAITAPTAPSAAYVQAEAVSTVDAVNALIAANAAQATVIQNLLTALASRGIVDNQTTA